MAQVASASPLNLGFLTILQESGGTMGGYLVTNSWGRPLEFRLSSAVQPNRVQQILYAGTLLPYVCGELIGKTLVEKSSTPIMMVVTDHEAALEVRSRLNVPVACMISAAAARPGSVWVRPEEEGQPGIICHPRFPADQSALRELLDRLDHAFDLSEPFARIREAVGEARKMSINKAA